MAATRSVLTTEDLTGIAPGHVDGWGFALPVREPPWFIGGSGGAISTARDLGRWLTIQITPDQPSVLSPAGIRSMHTPSDPTGRYGFGWSVSGPASHRLISHNGALFTYTAYQVIAPSTGYGIAVLANRGYTLGRNDAEAIGRGLLEIAEGRNATVAMPWWRLIDVAFAVGTLAVFPLAAWWATYTRRSVRLGRRRLALAVPGIVVAASCQAVLFALPTIGGNLSGHRDITLRQVAHVSPATVTLLLAVSVAAVVVTALAALGTRTCHVNRGGAGIVRAVASGASPSVQPRRCRPGVSDAG
jgi:hypothetical protein